MRASKIYTMKGMFSLKDVRDLYLPSYHRIIHKGKPHFDRKALAFEFPNGLVEKVKIDKHLSVKT